MNTKPWQENMDRKNRANMIDRVYPMGTPCCECANTSMPALESPICRISYPWSLASHTALSIK